MIFAAEGPLHDPVQHHGDKEDCKTSKQPRPLGRKLQRFEDLLAKATAAGLTTRPLVDTIVDTLTWLDDEYLPGWKQAMADRGEADAVFGFGEGRPGITREREAELLEMWKAR